MDFVEQPFTSVIARASGPLTFWTKAASAIEIGPFYVNVKYRDGTSEPAFLVSPTTSWQHKSVAVDTTKRLKLIQFSLGESGSVYVDDVSLHGSRRLLSAATVAAGAKKKAPKKPRKPAARTRAAK